MQAWEAARCDKAYCSTREGSGQAEYNYLVESESIQGEGSRRADKEQPDKDEGERKGKGEGGSREN